MTWEIRAKCERCAFTLPSFGPYASLGQYADDPNGPTLNTLRDEMRAHEANEHGGLS